MDETVDHSVYKKRELHPAFADEGGLFFTTVTPAELQVPPPPKFRVDMYGALNDLDPIETHWTFGSWQIEGNYLITWDEAGLRTASFIPLIVTRITTTEQGRHEIKDMNEEAEDVADAPPEQAPRERASTVGGDAATTIDSPKPSTTSIGENVDVA
jgi:hypothetical protein